MSEHMQLWEAVKRPPESALKKITGGRLSGMTDISPQWRYQVLTEQFGPCGEGWRFDIVKVWTQQAPEEQQFVFAQVNLAYRHPGTEEWSTPIPGIGGSMLIAKEKNGLHANDEGYKMAVTDALSCACKMLGIAADVYLGQMDGSKYKETPQNAPESKTAQPSTQGRAHGATSNPGQSGEPKCPKCGSTNLWDNRATKKNPKQPDFKCKNKECGGAIWLTPKQEELPQDGPPPDFEPPAFDANDDVPW